MSQLFDIAVIGTGPVGLAGALGLQKRGFNVALVGAMNNSVFTQAKGTWDPRVYALTPQSQQYLQQLKVWPQLEIQRLAAVRNIEVSQNTMSQKVLFESANAQLDRLATIVEHGHLVAQLSQAVHYSAVQCFAGLPSSLIQQANRCEVGLANGTLISAKLVVAADGANSIIRQLAHIEVQQKAYEQIAVVATLTGQQPHNGLARQWFAPNGVIALLPLPDPCALNLVWSAPDQWATQLLAMSEVEFSDAVTQASVGSFGPLQLQGSRQSVPLQNQRSCRLIGTRLVLVGDAAHVVHPMAGHGLNLGFGDLQALEQVLTAAPIDDPGVRVLLRKYERARAQPIAVMNRVTDGLFRVFFDAPTSFTVARDIGWRIVSQSDMLKRKMIEHASTN